MARYKLWNTNWNCNSKDYYEDYEINREELKTIFQKIKNGKIQNSTNMDQKIKKTYFLREFCV